MIRSIVGMLLITSCYDALLHSSGPKRKLSRLLSSIQPQLPPSFDFTPYHESFTSLTRQQWNLLTDLAGYLYDWNTKVNLISRKDISLLVPNHIIPSLAICKVRGFVNGEKIIDVGTGGGLPGLPMAIACPDAQFTLLDSNGKKMAVVEDIKNKLKLKNVRIIKSRAEEFKEEFDFMLGRAVSAVPSFLSFSSHFLGSMPKSTSSNDPHLKSGLLYLKGGDFAQELADAQIKDYQLFPVDQLAPIVSDKKVLYIPQKEIIKFHNMYSKNK